MGRSGRAAFEYGFDGAGASGEFPSTERVGAVYGRRHSGSERIGSADCLFALGEAGAEQGQDAYEPEAFGVKAPHPSPLSAYRGFFGCRHFSQANEFLKEHGEEPIDWQIEDIAYNA